MCWVGSLSWEENPAGYSLLYKINIRIENSRERWEHKISPVCLSAAFSALEDDGAKMASFLLSSGLTAVIVVQWEKRQRVESKVKGRVRKISPARLSAAVSTLEGSPVPLPWSFLLIAPAFCLLRFGPLNGNICNFLHNNQISRKWVTFVHTFFVSGYQHERKSFIKNWRRC